MFSISLYSFKFDIIAQSESICIFTLFTFVNTLFEWVFIIIKFVMFKKSRRLISRRRFFIDKSNDDFNDFKNYFIYNRIDLEKWHSHHKMVNPHLFISF